MADFFIDHRVAIERASSIKKNSEVEVLESLIKSLAESVVTPLYGLDLANIIDRRCSHKNTVNNIKYIFQTIQDKERLETLCLSFGSSMYVIDDINLYPFDRSNNHQIFNEIKVLNSDDIDPYKLVALHNLFRIMDGKEAQILDVLPELKSRFTENKLDLVNSIFPYFKLTQCENLNHYICVFNRTDLVEKINTKLAAPDFHIGQNIYNFLVLGEASTSYTKKYFNHVKESYAL